MMVRGDDEFPVFDALGRNQSLRNFPDRFTLSPQNHHFQTKMGIEMNMQS